MGIEIIIEARIDSSYLSPGMEEISNVRSGIFRGDTLYSFPAFIWQSDYIRGYRIDQWFGDNVPNMGGSFLKYNHVPREFLFKLFYDSYGAVKLNSGSFNSIPLDDNSIDVIGFTCIAIFGILNNPLYKNAEFYYTKRIVDCQ